MWQEFSKVGGLARSRSVKGGRAGYCKYVVIEYLAAWEQDRPRQKRMRRQLSRPVSALSDVAIRLSGDSIQHIDSRFLSFRDEHADNISATPAPTHHHNASPKRKTTLNVFMAPRRCVVCVNLELTLDRSCQGDQVPFPAVFGQGGR